MERDICFFGSEMAPSSDGVYIGGSATSAIRLAKSLEEAGQEIHIVSMAPRDWSTKRIQNHEGPEWANTHIFDAPAQHPGPLDGLNLLYSGTKTLLDYCRDNSIDIIHSHSGYSVLAAMAVLAGRLGNIPVVHTQYCPIPTNPRNIEEILSSPLPARITLNQTDHVFAMTNNILESLHSHGVENTSFVPPVVDTDEYRPDLSPPKSIEIDDEKLTVLFVGNLKPDKGVEFLIEGAGEATNAGIPLQLVLTTERDFPGSDERRQYLDELIDEYELQDDIVELGIIEDMPNVMAHADVLVAPFTTTSGPSDYPLAILEAMACNTPVIGSDVGGIPELLANSGYLIPPSDSSAISRALQDVAENETSDGGRSFIKKKFAPDAIANEVIEVYQDNV